MMKNKQNKECRMSNIVAAIVAAFLIIVALAMNIEAATWKVPARWNEPTDSTRLTFYKNGTSAMTAKRTTPRSYDTTLTVNNDTFYTAEFRIYFAGVDSAATWVWERFTTAGGASVGLGSESVRIFAIDTSGVDAAVQGVKITVRNAADNFVAMAYTGSNGSATFFLDQASGANRYGVFGNKLAYIFPNDTFSVTASIDSMAAKGYDMVFTGPTALDVCQVDGDLYKADGGAMAGVYIEAHRVSGMAATGLFDGINVIFSGEPVYTVTDTLGHFNLYLIRSNKYDPATNSFYNIKGIYDGKDIFEMKKVQIPSTGVLHLGDTLAARQ
ncbi:MAG: hypothetical protein Q8O19_07240 [Rectinemataceae bacterium]|nr:hypothetical protein [Rectinemataceae bacterium]